MLYYENENGKLYQGDCLEVFKTISNKSIDLIILDPPYFSTNKKDVGDNQWNTELEYIEWCLALFTECQRILKNNGSLYLFHNNVDLMTDILYKIKYETEFKFKNQITWDKLETGNQDFLMPLYKNSNKKRRYATSLTEYIYYFNFEDETGLKTISNDLDLYSEIRDYFKNERNKTNLSYKEINEKCFNSASNGGGMASNILTSYKKGWTFPTKEKYESLQKIGICLFPYEKLKYKYDIFRQEYEKLRYKFNQPYLTTPKDIKESRNTIRPFSTVWHYSRDEEIYKLHSTPKPLKMIEHIIEVSSNENDIILDPFSGSGTLAEASENTNRKWICIEKEEKYCEITKKRLDKLNQKRYNCIIKIKGDGIK